MQHLLVKTSRPAHLKASDWKVNGAGHKGANAPGGLGEALVAQIAFTVTIDYGL